MTAMAEHVCDWKPAFGLCLGSHSHAVKAVTLRQAAGRQAWSCLWERTVEGS